MPNELSTYINDFIRPINVNAKHRYNAVMYELMDIAHEAYSTMARVHLIHAPLDTILDICFYEDIHLNILPRTHRVCEMNYIGHHSCKLKSQQNQNTHLVGEHLDKLERMIKINLNLTETSDIVISFHIVF
jgi:hypothetical protein